MRIAVNNLAGVPSIVFGVFGVGFFCYIVGASIDELLFESRLPQPTFGTGGLSGPAIRPVAVRMTWQVARAVKIPVFGIGGSRQASVFLLPLFVTPGASHDL